MGRPLGPVVTLTAGERATLHAGVCRAHGDSVPGVYVCAPCERAGDEAAARIIAERLTASAPTIAEQRCRDVHPGIWSPTAWAYAGRTCPACTSWGQHVARLLLTAPTPTDPSRADPADDPTYTDPTETEGGA